MLMKWSALSASWKVWLWARYLYLLNGARAAIWAARETLLPAKFATKDKLEEIVSPFEPLMREISSGDRGGVVWLWANSQEELAGLRANLSAELDKAMTSDAPIPVVFVVPGDPSPELLVAYQRYVALDEFSTDERQRVGQKTYEHEVGLAKGSLLRALQLLRGDQTNYLDVPRSPSAFRVPKAYRSSIDTMAKPSVRRVLGTSYKVAYRNAPPAFFTQYKLSNARQKSATKLVANLMLENAPEALRKAIQSDNVAADLCAKFLQKEWSMLTRDYRIQEPDNQAVRRAWRVLDEAFPPGKETSVEEAIIALLNAPNGYDANTATLLFCAWFGYHDHDLQVSIQGRLSNRSSLAESLRNGPKDFINEICITRPVSIARRDPGQIVKDVQLLLDKVRLETFTQAQAQKDLATLEEFAEDTRHNPEIRSLAANAAATLKGGLETAIQYDQHAAEMWVQLASGDLATLGTLLGRIGKLPQPSLVLSTARTPAEIRSAVQDRLVEAVEMDCKKFENLQKLTQLEHLLAQLKERQKLVVKVGIAPLVERFDRAWRTCAPRQPSWKSQSVRTGCVPIFGQWISPVVYASCRCTAVALKQSSASPKRR